MKNLIKAIYSIFFLTFFINHFLFFNTNYFKFSTIQFVNENNLNFFYYFMIVFELVSIFIVFFKLNKNVIRVYDFLLIIYCVVVPTALYCIYELTNGCPQCHFISSSFISNQYFNIFVIVGLGLIYLYKLRDTLIKRQSEGN